MPLKTKPLNQNVLTEVLRDDDGVSRSDENESLKYGILRDYSLSGLHLTASSAYELTPEMFATLDPFLKKLVGKIVRWEEFAEGGQTFVEDGKTYALIPWWRLISYEEGEL